MINKRKLGLIAGLLLTLGSAVGQAEAATITEHSKHNDIIHRTMDISTDYNSFITNLQKLAGHYDPQAAKKVLSDPVTAKAMYKSMEGDQGLVLFNAMPHGNLLQLSKGAPKKSMLLSIGNALIASELMAGDIRTGLYVPLSVYVWQVKPGLVRVEYDLPSSLLGQFHVNSVSTLAASLDTKLSQLVKDAAKA